MKYSVFTVGLPNSSPEEALIKMKEYGYNGVEWRVIPVDPAKASEAYSYWGNNKCTIDENTVVEEAANIKALCAKHGMEICALGSYMSCSDPIRVEKVLKAAQIMGCPRIRVNVKGYNPASDYNTLLKTTIEELKVVEQLAKKYGVKANIEMHMGNIAPSASAAYRVVSNFDPKYIGVIYDVGNIITEGYEEYKMALEILGEYLDHVHIKNAKWELKSEENGVEKYSCNAAPFKKGIADFSRFLAILKKHGYDDYLSFEDFSDTALPDEKLKGNVDYIKSIVDSL